MSATAGSLRTGKRQETALDTQPASSPGRSSASASATSVGHPGAASRPHTSSSRSDNTTIRDVTCPMPYRRRLFLRASSNAADLRAEWPAVWAHFGEGEAREPLAALLEWE